MTTLITIVVLLLGAAAFIFGGMLFPHDPKRAPSMGKRVLKKCVKLVAILLLIVGVNMTGVGTSTYLVKKNPLILEKMIEGMQTQKTEEMSKGVAKYLKSHEKEMMENAVIAGNVDAKNTIFMFSAHSCGYCRRVHAELKRVIESNPDVRVVVKTFSIHGTASDIPARAIIAAKMQDNAKAVALDNMLMEREYMPADKGGDMAAAIQKNVMSMAAQVGLDTKKLAADMNSDTVNKELYQVMNLSQEFNITGTPFLIINGKTFPGAIPQAEIEKALK